MWNFLWNEIREREFWAGHDAYRAVRAICRLHQEGDLALTDKEKQRAHRFERTLRQYAEPYTGGPRNLLPVDQAIKFIAKVREKYPCGG